MQASRAPGGTGLATPTVVNQGGTAVLIVSVAPGSNPTSTGLGVSVDLSAIGGSAAQPFYDDGTHGDQVASDGIFSFSTTLAIDATPGSFQLPVTITDAQSRTGDATISISVSDTLFQNGFE